jgi:F-type H+-transporting ATPase subunit b
MRRTLLALALGLAIASAALPQEPAGTGGSNPTSAQAAPSIWWNWVNFAILAAGLGYLAAKHAPSLFQARSQEIQQALGDAEKIMKDAQAQAAAIDLRLKNLEVEIENLRQSARAEMAAEGERVRRETEKHLARIQEQSIQEIHLMTRGALDELRKYSADLAIGLAQQRIQARLSPDVQQNLVDGFLNDLRARMPVAART